MKDIPILMSDLMIRAYKSQLKTMTRRVIKPQPRCDLDGAYFDAYNGGPQWNWWLPDGRMCNSHDIIKCPYGQPGDRLIFKEALRTASYFDDSKPTNIEAVHPIQYRADMEDNEYIPNRWGRWRSSMFMPHRFARFTPKIINIKAERLQEISEVDCFSEGIEELIRGIDPDAFDPDSFEPLNLTYPYNVFAKLWNSINVKPKPVYKNGNIVKYISYPWEDIREFRRHRGNPLKVIGNPMVWVIEFERYQK